MNRKPVIYSLTVALLASMCITLTGCTDDVEGALPYITIAVETGTAIALKKQSAATRKDVYNISAALRALSSGQLPTVAALNNAIAIYTTDAGAAAIGKIVADTYAKYYAKLSANGNAKEGADLLEALAQGIENGASQS
jgi:ABC-type amino acid transport substrate-binding protein